MGYLIYRVARRGRLEPRRLYLRSLPALLVVSVTASLLPDIDAAVGFTSGDFGRYHNNGTHSLVSGLLVALSGALFLAWKDRTQFLNWFWVIFFSYGSHVILDFFTQGRGVMLFWPFTSERFGSPVKLFLGVRWSEGWISIEHFWTLVTELIFVLIIGLVVWALGRREGVTDRSRSTLTQ
jgi:inner membrane protein